MVSRCAHDDPRGSVGDPADDLTALTVNYLFFALLSPGAWADGFKPLWDCFWSEYSSARSDAELSRVVAPFFTWRALVLACPRWYPEVSAETRERLFGFVERLLAGEPFRPGLADELFAH